MSRKKIEIDLSDKNIASVIEKSILDENIRLKKENEKLRIEVSSWKNKAQAVDYDLRKKKLDDEIKKERRLAREKSQKEMEKYRKLSFDLQAISDKLKDILPDSIIESIKDDYRPVEGDYDW